MTRLRLHPENHFVTRIGWLRAAVLGSNDGIVSTAPSRPILTTPVCTENFIRAEIIPCSVE
jgi:hypothetical protein